MGRILEEAEIKFLKKCARACEAAVKQSAKEIQKDFKKKVIDRTVLDYYEDYTPVYRRREDLYNAFRVIPKAEGQEIQLRFKWNFNWLSQHKSNSSYHKFGKNWIDYSNRGDGEDNGVPEKGWIFQNFMEGIHPIFEYDASIGDYVDVSMEFEPSYKRLRRYRDEYINSGDMKYILLKNLKRRCRNL